MRYSMELCGSIGSDSPTILVRRCRSPPPGNGPAMSKSGRNRSGRGQEDIHGSLRGLSWSGRSWRGARAEHRKQPEREASIRRRTG